MSQPSCDRIAKTKCHFAGFVERYLKSTVEQWLLVAPWANPAMIEMFHDREYPPFRDLLPWSGEFAGKYLTAGVQVLRVTGDGRLKDCLRKFVSHVLQYQGSDGYMGPWPSGCHLTNRDPADRATWDTWGHYHIMLGLILWHEETGDGKALDSAAAMADLLCRKYMGQVNTRLVETSNTEKNLAPIHTLSILYRKTGQSRYLDMALQIADEFAAQGDDGPLAGDYLRLALAGRALFETFRPRWESLHPIMGLAELYWITDEHEYRAAFEQLWWSIVQHDRHNNGGFSSGERATGNPYDLRPIETCCTIAWIAMSVEMLKMTANSIVADEIELTTLNSILGMHSPTGRWATYNTPMNGLRRASTDSIAFQARAGSPELNCCSVNSPRGLGMISDWALMRDMEGLILNWYGPCTMTTDLKPGLSVALTQETDYPVSGSVTLRVDPLRPASFTIKLRVPHWSAQTQVSLNGERISSARPGCYLPLSRTWDHGDTIELRFDMSLRFWAGERECTGLTSIYRGPILLAYDHRHNLQLAHTTRTTMRDYAESPPSLYALLNVPSLDARAMKERLIQEDGWLRPLIVLEIPAAEEPAVRLCDFASAGAAGTPYVSWLPVRNIPGPVAFSRANPLRATLPTAPRSGDPPTSP